MNIASLILLGIILQIGGAYIVNAAVEYFASSAAAQGSADGAAAAAALQYIDYMAYIKSIEPRQFAHVVFVAPLIEEIVFRLIFLRAGKMVMPFWAANIAQSVMFAIYHSYTIQRIYVFVMGLIIGAVFYYCPIIYRNASAQKPDGGALRDIPDALIGVGATFILHMVINGSGLFLVPLFPADIPLPAQVVIGCILMAVAGGTVYILYRQAKSAAAETLPEGEA